MCCGDYNGWTNYETWLVNVWLTNDPWAYEESMNKAEEGVEAFRQWVEEFVWLGVGVDEGTEVQACAATDLIKSALSVVNYRELVDSLPLAGA